jgi:Xaa-Pro aminopeptidase
MPPFSTSEYDRRISGLHDLLVDGGLDAFVAFTTALYRIPGAVRYLCDYEPLWGSAAFLYLPQSGERHLLVDSFWDVQGRAEQTVERQDVNCSAVDGLGVGLAALLPRSARRVGVVNDESLPAAAWTNVCRALPNVAFVEASKELQTVREVKSTAELEVLRETAALSSLGAATLAEHARPGVSEKELADVIQGTVLKGGAERLWTFMMVASGRRSGFIYVLPSTKLLEPGDAVHWDMGVSRGGYHGDIQRTVILPGGSPDPIGAELLEGLLEIQPILIENLRPGRLPSDLNAEFLELVRERGLSRYLPDWPEDQGLLGHGIGTDGHEDPLLRSTDETILKEDMVLTLEPMLIAPRIAGVGIEDMVRVSASGGERLTLAPWRLAATAA